MTSERDQLNENVKSNYGQAEKTINRVIDSATTQEADKILAKQADNSTIVKALLKQTNDNTKAALESVRDENQELLTGGHTGNSQLFSEASEQFENADKELKAQIDEMNAGLVELEAKAAVM